MLLIPGLSAGAGFRLFIGPLPVTIQHYGNTAIAALFVAVMGAFAVFRRRDWRFSAWSSGLVALYFWAASAVFPTAASSLGRLGGVLMVAWALVFVALVERRRGSLLGDPPSIENATARSG